MRLSLSKNEIGIADSPPIVTSHGNYFRCFRFCHDNCDLTETTVRNDCRKRLSSTLDYHGRSAIISDGIDDTLFQKGKSAILASSTFVSRETNPSRFNQSFFLPIISSFFSPFSNQKINDNQFSACYLSPILRPSSSIVRSSRKRERDAIEFEFSTCWRALV